MHKMHRRARARAFEPEPEPERNITMSKDLGNRIAEMLSKRGITQKELAQMAGISRPALSMHLNSPTTSHLSETKKRKIDELFRKYNYRPNLAACSQQGKKLQIAGIYENLFSIPQFDHCCPNCKTIFHGGKAVFTPSISAPPKTAAESANA